MAVLRASRCGYVPGAFVFVIVGIDKEPYEAFILTGIEVAARAEKARKDYVDKPHQRPLVEKDQPLMLGLPELEDRRDRWDIIFGVAPVTDPHAPD